MVGLFLALHIEHPGELVLLLRQQFQQCLYQDLVTVVFLPFQVLTVVFLPVDLQLKHHHQTFNCTGENNCACGAKFFLSFFLSVLLFFIFIFFFVPNKKKNILHSKEECSSTQKVNGH